MYKELREFCELGVISVGSDGVISAAAPPAEIAHYDDGKIQTLIDSQLYLLKYPSTTCSDVANTNDAPPYLTLTPR